MTQTHIPSLEEIRGNMKTKTIVDIEEQAIQLKQALDAFYKELPPASTAHYGDAYNYLGTLKVNLLSLAKAAHTVAARINIAS